MEQWIDVAAAADLPPGEVVEVVAGAYVLAIANVGGELHAIDGICAHQGGPLGKGRLENCILTCPWHGWQFHVATGKQILSATIRQRSFAVRQAADRIQIMLPTEDVPT